MQVILDGTQQALGRLITFCDRSANESLEGGWQIIHLSDDEEEEEPTTQESDVTPPRRHSLTEMPVVLQPSAQNLPKQKRSVVTKLNDLAQRISPISPRARNLPQRSAVTPLWSPDPSEQEEVEEENIRRVRQISVQDQEDDWDIINNDLELTLVKEFPSAAKKLSRAVPRIPGPDSVVDSIEDAGCKMGTFMAELLHAAEPIQTTVDTSGCRF